MGPYPERPYPYGANRALADVYERLRADCAELEQLIETSPHLDEQERKRLDKAVTVMKVGFKIAKKALRARGKSDPARSRFQEDAATFLRLVESG